METTSGSIGINILINEAKRCIGQIKHMANLRKYDAMDDAVVRLDGVTSATLFVCDELANLAKTGREIQCNAYLDNCVDLLDSASLNHFDKNRRISVILEAIFYAKKALINGMSQSIVAGKIVAYKDLFRPPDSYINFFASGYKLSEIGGDERSPYFHVGQFNRRRVQRIVAPQLRAKIDDTVCSVVNWSVYGMLIAPIVGSFAQNRKVVVGIIHPDKNIKISRVISRVVSYDESEFTLRLDFDGINIDVLEVLTHFIKNEAYFSVC